MATRRCYSATPSGNLLDQMQRTLIGVTRDGGSVYKNHATLRTASTTSKSSSIPSGLRVLSVTDAIQAKMKSLRAPSGRLDHFHHGLTVPMRNVPWIEETSHTVVPSQRMNPHYYSDRSRHTTVNRALSVGSVPDMSIPHIADQFRRDITRNYNKTEFRQASRNQSERNKARERISADLDLRRVAYKSACISDYHNRVGRKVCHVI